MSFEEILCSLRDIGLSNPEEEMVLITDEPKIPGYLCFLNDKATGEYSTGGVFGQGFDTDKTKARVKALGECLERLCLYNPDENKFLLSAYRSDSCFTDPALFCCYSEEQLPRVEFLKRLRQVHYQYRWWPVLDLTSGQERFMPAQLVFLSSILDDEIPIRKERISTGAALGQIGTQHALASGFMESIERDACISSYLTKRSMRRIINLPKDLTDLLECITRYQLDVNVFDATTDLEIPTALVVTLDHTGIGPAVNVGSRSDTNYYDAIKYAVLESIHCRRNARIMIGQKQIVPNEEEINSMDDRFFYWCPLERISDIGFWLKDKVVVSYMDLIEGDTTLKRALETVKSRGYHILVADITLKPIRDKGFEVLKVVIPELHPLYLDERAKALYSLHFGDIKEDKSLKPHPLT